MAERARSRLHWPQSIHWSESVKVEEQAMTLCFPTPIWRLKFSDYESVNATHVWMAHRVLDNHLAGNLAFDADGDLTVSTSDLADIESGATDAAASAAAAASSASAASSSASSASTSA